MRILNLDGDYHHSLKIFELSRKMGFDVDVVSRNIFAISNFSYLPKRRFVVDDIIRGLYNFNIDIKKAREFVRKISFLHKKRKYSALFSNHEEKIIPILLFDNEIDLPHFFPKWRIFEILLNKRKTYKKFSKFTNNSIKIPKIIKKDPEFPCVIKCSISFGGIGNFFCSSYEEFTRIVNELEKRRIEYVIQKFIPTKRLIVANVFFEENKILRAFLFSNVNVNKKLREKMIKSIEKFLRKIKWNGFASPQFLYFDEKLYLMEINPRLSGTVLFDDYNTQLIESYLRYYLFREEIKKKVVYIGNLKADAWMLKVLWGYFNRTFDFLPIIKLIESYLKRDFLKMYRSIFNL